MSQTQIDLGPDTASFDALRDASARRAYSGPTAHRIMAAFVHCHDEGARFNDGESGAWYAALDIDTAIAETVYHQTRRLSVRRQEGTNICVFKPAALVRPLRQGGNYLYAWDAAGTVRIAKLSELQNPTTPT